MDFANTTLTPIPLSGQPLSERQAGENHHGRQLSPAPVYKLMKNHLSWSVAKTACQAAGMRLASVHSASENALLVTAAAGNQVWIGGTDAASEGTWKWSPSGMPLSYTNWYYREPNNDWGNEHCLELVPRWSGKWNDLDCTANRKYVCETRPTRHIYMEWKFPAEHNVSCKDSTTLTSAAGRRRWAARAEADNTNWRPRATFRVTLLLAPTTRPSGTA